MPGKLDDMIAPDERVVYRARAGWRELLWSYLAYTVFLILASLTLYWLRGVDVGGDTYPLYPFAVLLFLMYMIPLMVDITSWLRNKAALVTDRRVLYTTGIFKPKVMEIPLADIEGVAHLRGIPGGGVVKIRLPTGKFVGPYFGWGSARLCAAIKAQLGLPQPAEPTRKVFLWAGFVWALRPLSLLFFLLAIFYPPLFGILMSILVWLDPQQTSILSVLLVVGVFYLLLKIAVLVANTLALCLVRAFLSAHEAKQMICLGYDPLSGDKWWERLSRRRIRHQERLLGRLYGQPIRCAEGE